MELQMQIGKFRQFFDTKQHCDAPGFLLGKGQLRATEGESGINLSCLTTGPAPV